MLPGQGETNPTGAKGFTRGDSGILTKMVIGFFPQTTNLGACCDV